MIYFCETYFVLGTMNIRKLDLFFFILEMPCPKPGCFFLGVCFYLRETILIFDVMTEKAENKTHNLIKLLIIIKRELLVNGSKIFNIKIENNDREGYLFDLGYL